MKINRKTAGLLIFLIPVLIIGSFVLFHRPAPLVSVVMPVYNGAAYLDRSINSILKQSYPDFELIMIEDGSSDNSWQILQNYAAKDPRIRLLKNDRNRGISYSRNRGNDAARGKYIMMMDQDDDNHPDRILKQAAYMESHPELTISATPSQSGHEWFKFQSDELIKYGLFFNNNYGHPNLMVRRDFLKKNNIRYNLDYKCANDYEWLIQIRDKGGVFGGMSEALFIYNGPNYSAEGGPCYEESRKIMRRWSELDIGMEQYVCNIMELILSDSKYQRMFSDSFRTTIRENRQKLCHSLQK
ncbi:MAG: glycosyltransferase family 2 protein [Alphaproteobacteria bacterium]|nr:glycosyltransferase family 2 protein [Alphaproteobacteria bacterium]